MSGNLAFHGARPIALGGSGHDDHGPAVARVPILHRLEHGDDLRVVAAVFQREDVPPVGSPLFDEVVAVELAGDDSAQQDIVDARVVVGKDDPQALAHLQREGLGLEFLRVALPSWRTRLRAR